MAPESQILIYQPEDGKTRIDVLLEDETVWLTQSQMADLFQTTKQNISLHIQNIYDEAEIEEAATVKDYLTVQTEGNRSVQRSIKHYNLDAIIAVGYRVRSHRGTQFRRWAPCNRAGNAPWRERPLFYMPLGTRDSFPYSRVH